MLALITTVVVLAFQSQLPVPPPVSVCVPTPITPCDEPIPLPIPIPPPPCIPSPITQCDGNPPAPPPPPPADLPPVFPQPLVVVERTKIELTVKWKKAIDDHRVTRYMFMRDKTILGWRTPTTTKYTFKLKCGRHVYRVVAIDVYLQYGVNQLTLTRKCPT